VGGEIVGSQDAVSAVTVALIWEDIVICSATVLDIDTVLTAAHCLDLSDEVVFGRDVTDPAAPRRKITGRAAAPGWDPSVYDRDPLPPNLNDVAVVHFEGGLPDGYRPVRLADATMTVPSELIIAGFGVDDGKGDTGEGRLRKANVMTLDAGFSQTELKIDAAHGIGDCSGDSGGPAFTLSDSGLVQVGIDNWGPGGCDQFGVYAKVAAHRDWIRQAIGDLRSPSLRRR
jgi:hypothetical protein